MASHLGMEIVAYDAPVLTMRMPVDHRTIQPYGILNGAASMALAETVASYAGNIHVQGSDCHCVGLEINGNHLKPVRTGYVYGTASPIHLGKKTHVWDIDILREDNQLVCKARMTLAVIKNGSHE